MLGKWHLTYFPKRYYRKDHLIHWHNGYPFRKMNERWIKEPFPLSPYQKFSLGEVVLPKRTMFPSLCQSGFAWPSTLSASDDPNVSLIPLVWDSRWSKITNWLLCLPNLYKVSVSDHSHLGGWSTILRNQQVVWTSTIRLDIVHLSHIMLVPTDASFYMTTYRSA